MTDGDEWGSGRGWMESYEREGATGAGTGAAGLPSPRPPGPPPARGAAPAGRGPGGASAGDGVGPAEPLAGAEQADRDALAGVEPVGPDAGGRGAGGGAVGSAGREESGAGCPDAGGRGAGGGSAAAGGGSVAYGGAAPAAGPAGPRGDAGAGARRGGPGGGSAEPLAGSAQADPDAGGRDAGGGAVGSAGREESGAGRPDAGRSVTPAAGSGGEGPDAARASRPEAGDGAAPVAGSAGPGAGSGAGAEQADRESAAPDAEGRAARGGAAGPAEAGDGAAPVAGSAGPGAGSGAAEGGGIAGLRLPYQIAAAICGVLVVGVACVHLGMVFLHVAPSNTVTKKHGDSVQWWVYPEFEQNWKLFAPNPLQQNISVQVRAEYTDAGGNRRTSDWIDLTGQDGEAIRGNLFPSHVHQNQLRRGWDFYVGAHADGQRADGVRARLSERYIRRIAMQRLDREDLGQVQRIQMRSESRAIRPPAWSTEKVDTRPVHNVLPWWTVTGADLPGGVDNLPAEAAR